MARTRPRRRVAAGWLAIGGCALGIGLAAALGGSPIANADNAKSSDTAQTSASAGSAPSRGPAKAAARAAAPRAAARAAAPRAAAVGKVRRAPAVTASASPPRAASRATARSAVLPPANWEQDQSLFTGKPSLLTTLLVGPIRVFSIVANLVAPVGIDPGSANEPPWWSTLGLNTTLGEAQGMPVWTISSPNPSGKVVVAIHGGGYVSEPTIFHWLTYTEMARQTGATVVVPIYPTVPQGGTAQVAVPQMTAYLQDMVTQYGADNVSVMGDSAGGGLALAAVQQMVLQGGTPPPGRMVLISPWLDITLSDPAIPLTRDPIALPAVKNLTKGGLQWSAGLDLTDPWVSPLYGSLEGLPQTTVYAGSMDATAPDVLRLRDKAIANGVDVGFVLRAGEWHVWPLGVVLPDAVQAMNDIYGQLGLVS